MREGLTHTSLLQAPAASPRVPLPLAPSQSFVLPLTPANPAMLAICFQAGSESEGLLRSCFLSVFPSRGGGGPLTSPPHPLDHHFLHRNMGAGAGRGWAQGKA